MHAFPLDAALAYREVRQEDVRGGARELAVEDIEQDVGADDLLRQGRAGASGKIAFAAAKAAFRCYFIQRTAQCHKDPRFRIQLVLKTP